MDKQVLTDAMIKLTSPDCVFPNEKMDQHTTFRVGGPCSCLVNCENKKSLKGVLRFLKEEELPFFLLGKGSNLLVSDEGFEGVVIMLTGDFMEMSASGQSIICGAGASMAQVARLAYENGLTGFEFASGIPGTMGGGIIMNAGAYGGEMCQVVTTVEAMDYEGTEYTFTNEQMLFSYRNSALKNKPFVVTGVHLSLQVGEKERIRAYMEELSEKRRSKQPLNYPSAGSTFKRPEGHFAGALIMNAGLSGYRVGDACVSEKHCGFVVNLGHATAQDIQQLITHVQEEVYAQFGVRLEPEVIFL